MARTSFLRTFKSWFRRRLVAIVAFGTTVFILLHILSTFRPTNGLIPKIKKWEEVYSDQLTVVTAYFNLGSFIKGGPSKKFTNNHYRQWMTAFASINNSLIAFIDNDDDYQFFSSIRSDLPEHLTKLIRVNRNQMWSFQIESRISKIYDIPGYPKHFPNTVVPAYSSVMHAKYEVMQMAIRENPFRTKYFCWLDIGYFRDLTSAESVKSLTYVKPKKFSRFRLELPSNFSKDSVSYGQIYDRVSTRSPKDIVYGNHVWLGGGYFVGEHSVLYRWTEEYLNATMTLLDQKLMSTDQQVIYSMFNTMKPKTKIQTYIGDGRYNGWFHLGFISRKML